MSAPVISKNMAATDVTTGDVTTGIVIRSIDDADRLMASVRNSAAKAHQWIAEQSRDPLAMLKSMKFEQVGFHPMTGDALNIIEQINQTWTFAVAIAATKKLLDLHPEAGGFRLAPGAHAALPLDIMSVCEGLVGAETFAAVHPRNNKKLSFDLDKLARCSEKHRYVFFMSPAYPNNVRHESLEREGVQVWSVDF
jgi:hypothetical protein